MTPILSGCTLAVVIYHAARTAGPQPSDCLRIWTWGWDFD